MSAAEPRGPSARTATRRIVLAGILLGIRTRRRWSILDAASQARIAPMTWRRLEDALEVRQRTLTAVDHLLGQPAGTVRRALDDDGVLATLVAMTGIDTPPADPEEIAPYLDALAERLRTGVVTRSPSVDPVNRRLASEPSQQTSLSAVPTVVVAAHVIDRLSRRTPTPMIEQAITAILDAMPDLVRATSAMTATEDTQSR